MTKDEIKNAPDYDESTWDDTSRTTHDDYYGRFSGL